MSVKLVKAYIAKKVAMRYPMFAFAKETMSKESYQSLVLSKKASYFSEEMLNGAKAAIVSRFNIKDHRKIFKNPTLAQWISDVLGNWSQQDIMAFFSERSGFSATKFENSTIGDTVLNRPFLISLVEELEDATGKILCNYAAPDMPLAYLGEDTTYGEIASFFSNTGIADRICEKRREYGID